MAAPQNNLVIEMKIEYGKVKAAIDSVISQYKGYLKSFSVRIKTLTGDDYTYAEARIASFKLLIRDLERILEQIK